MRLLLRVVLTMVIAGALFLCSGCKQPERITGPVVREPNTNGTAFLVELGNVEQATQYIANFQKSLNAKDSKFLEYIASDGETTRRHLKYLDNKELQSLFKFYMSNVKMEFVEFVEIDGQQYFAVKTDFLDNRYNDFRKPQITENRDPRQEFLTTVDEMIKESVAKGDGNTIEVPAVHAETGLPILTVDEEQTIPKATSHKGWNYTTKSEINTWAELLTEHVSELTTFSRVMYFRYNRGAEFTTISIDSDDLLCLLGNLPVYYGLDSTYTIQDYDIYYNYLQFRLELPNIESEIFTQWNEIRQQSDYEIQQQALEQLDAQGKVFGVYNIDNDLPKIRQNILPASLGDLFGMYYTDQVRAYYTFLFENPEYQSLVSTLRENMELELIKQSGKEYQLVVTMPDLDEILLKYNKEKLKPKQMVSKLVEVIQSGDYKQKRVYSTVTLQSSANNIWGFQMTHIPIAQILNSSSAPAVLRGLGVDNMLNAKLDSDGFLISTKEFLEMQEEAVIPEIE